MTGAREFLAGLFGREQESTATHGTGQSKPATDSGGAGAKLGDSPTNRGDAEPDPMEAYEKPLPDLLEGRYAQPFWAATTEERLLIQHCQDCGEHQYFPRPWCHHCHSDGIEWIEADGTGTVYSYTVVRRAVSNPEFAEDVPYVTAYVELAEGPRMLTMLTGCSPDTVERGMPVEVRFERVSEEVALPLFEPQ